MNLHLTKDQARLVARSIEYFSRSLKKDLQAADPVVVKTLKPQADEDLFQLELLETWFDKQREMEV